MIAVSQFTFSQTGTWAEKHTKLSLFHTISPENEPETIEQIPLEVWNETHFSASIIEVFGTDNEYLWFPASSNLTLQGSRHFNQHHAFQVRATYVPNEECGMTFQQYVDDVRTIYLNFFIANEYIDPKDFDNPIQIAFKDYYNTFIEIDSQTYADLYIRK